LWNLPSTAKPPFSSRVTLVDQRLFELLFTLYQLSLCGSNVGCESEQKAVGDALLHCDAGAGVGVIAPQSRVDGQAG
jgi:hypothetical protein